MATQLPLAQVHRRGPAWYRGDFHCHTHFSDGVLPPADLLALARTEGLDFFAMTDHNTLEAYPGFGEQAGLLIIPGVEATFKEGHFNVFGLEDGADWMAKLQAGQPWRTTVLGGDFPTTTALMQATAAHGWLNSINHPRLSPWDWRDGDTDLRLLTCLEVWNDPSWPQNVEGNPQAVQLWTDLLNAGHRLTAIGGSDFHRPEPGPKDPPKEAERLGLPSTYVYAGELSGAAILQALREHRAYVSMGPTATFGARLGEQEFGIGADLGVVSGEIVLQGAVQNSPRNGLARLVKGGQSKEQLALPLENGACALEWRDQVKDGESGWYRLEAWDEAGQLLVITNPIFFGPRQTPERNRFGDFVTGLG